MSDPFSFLPFALAAGGGTINGVEVQQLVAAGVTLLQRSPSLVRALSGRRSAIVLPVGPEWLLALAASDGRAALVIAPETSALDIASQLASANVGAIFTVEDFTSKLPADIPVVFLDSMPKRASVLVSGRRTTVDLGSHHGLTLRGARDVDGADDECLVAYRQVGTTPNALEIISHRAILRWSRDTATALSLTPTDHVLAISPGEDLSAWQPELTSALAAPLLRGASLTVHVPVAVPAPTNASVNGMNALEFNATSPFSVVMAPAEFWSAIVGERGGHQPHRLPDAVRHCAVIGPPPDSNFPSEFALSTGIPLHTIHATICNRDARCTDQSG